jgi:hypothetical protein
MDETQKISEFEIHDTKVDWRLSPYYINPKIGDKIVLVRMINPAFPSDITGRTVGVIKDIQDNEMQEFSNRTSKMYLCETATKELIATDSVLLYDEFVEFYQNKINGYLFGIERVKELIETL